MAYVLGLVEAAALLAADKRLVPAGWSWAAFELRFGIAFAAYLALVAWLLRGRPPRWLWWVLGLGFGLRLVLALHLPFLSGDIYRYVWDGRVLANGINPYRYPPADPALAFLRDGQIWPQVGRPDWRTPYPPLAEASFLLAGGSVIALKLLWVIADAASCWLLVRILRREGRDPLQVAIYACNPLVILEFAGSGHVDALAVPFVLLALWWGGSRAGLALGLASLAKGYPAALLPALRRRWAVPLFAAVVAAAYLPFTAYALQSVGAMFALDRFNAALPDHLGLAVWAATAAVVFWRVADPAWGALLLAAAALVATPVVMPWYLGWLVALAALRPSPAAIWASGAVMLSYLYYAQTPWRLPHPVWLLEYGSIALAVALETFLRRFGRRCFRSASG